MTIAAVGNSGLATGPHLHYEIHVNGRVVDPLTFVLPDAIPD
jgi:murein DD-endopeptidase MepM/ murein hydrolase activator NlpD